MTARSILAAVRAAGATLEADGESIVIRPAGVLPPALRAELVNAKAKVLAILRGTAPTQEACGVCESTSWALSLVDDEGGRTCRDCLVGLTQMRARGVPI